MKKLGPQIIVIFVLLLGIPLGAWKLIFIPANAREQELRSMIEARQERLRDLNNASAAITTLEREIDCLKDTIEVFQSRMPSEKEIDKVLHEDWQQAETCNMVTRSIRTMQRPGSLAPSGPFSEQPIAVQLEGDFAGLHAFLQAIEQQPRIVRIATMNIEKNEQGQEGTIRATMVMTVYFEGQRG